MVTKQSAVTVAELPADPPAGALSARDRLLAAANELFYEEGVNTVGIDRIIERAGVAKATLYSTFGSKDELIRAYLASRHQARRARIEAAVARYDTPRERLLAVFDALGDSIATPGFHGCAFVNATAEARPGSAILDIADESRAWVRDLFADLARAAGVTEPDVLARQLVMLYDGANVAARMDRDPSAASAARTVAASLLHVATSGRST
jgi:AcrR family transcriptional regulator